MDDGIIAALTVKYDTQKQGKERLDIARRICDATGVANLGAALEIGRAAIKTSTNPAVVEYRERRRRRTKQRTVRGVKKQYCKEIRKARRS